MSSTRTADAESFSSMGSALGDATLAFHNALARKLGLGLTEAKCMSLLERLGPLSAGDLSRRLGVTTGAITGLIDRLEKGGFVRRRRHTSDRRIIQVELLPGAARRGRRRALSDPLRRRVAQTVKSFNASEREAVARFVTAVTAILEQEAVRLNRE
jgi:DNA-binding MarR family transcriptional regulator